MPTTESDLCAPVVRDGLNDFDLGWFVGGWPRGDKEENHFFFFFSF